MKARPPFKFALLATACFTLATVVHLHALTQSDDILKMLFGDGRRVLAERFSRQADVYFHSGYYPSFFDEANKPNQSQSPMVTGQDEHHDHDSDDHDEHEGHHDEAEEAHEKEMSFLGRPRDWIEAFGRHFIVTEHTHLEGGREREILPWLRISASLDPHRIETYTVSAYWLRSRLGKVKEAEEFLREGLLANPNSPEILFELGRLYNENYHDASRARNVWELGLRRWRETEADKKEPNMFVFEQITVNLGRLEEDAGNFDKAISYFELGKSASPRPEALERQIEEIKKKKTAPRPAVP